MYTLRIVPIVITAVHRAYIKPPDISKTILEDERGLFLSVEILDKI